MIFVDNDIIKLNTPSTCLILQKAGSVVKMLHYGKKLRNGNFDLLSRNASQDAWANGYAISHFGKYDYREPLVLLENSDGTFTSYFEFEEAGLLESKPELAGLPASYGAAKTLELTFRDKRNHVCLKQRFSVFNDCDAIATSVSIVNDGAGDVRIKRCMSLQLDLPEANYAMHTFDGYWGRERAMHVTSLTAGIHCVDSKCGASSSFHNPYVLFEKTGRQQEFIAVNLVYSGNHKEIGEVSPFGRTRILTGINDFCFDWPLKPGEQFDAPEAVMCWGKTIRQVTEGMHDFVSGHIVRGAYKNAPRPIVYNNWEATYFDCRMDTVQTLADQAAGLGMELFVLDDGWFGKRVDESSSMGDWYDNRDKYPDGIAALAAGIRQKGMKFGIWMEPEMISEDSDIYRAHPEYAMRIPRGSNWYQRSQLMLDITKPEVRDYVVGQVNDVLSRTGAEYLKWDFNRLMTDVYTDRGSIYGTYFHKYILGLYDMASRIVKANPTVLFESCASGGARFDLGLMCFMPQVWTSDNTEAKDRVYIQEGSLYGYPENVMSCHVSICPNHQNGKSTAIESRFNVAAAGLLGYEMDLGKCSQKELETIRDQIVFYKQHRELLQYGRYIRLDSFWDGKYSGWMKVSEDQNHAIATVVVKEYMLEDGDYLFRFDGLDPEKRYSVKMRPQHNVEKVQEYTAYGDLLMTLGLNFGNVFDDTDRQENSNSIASRLFVIESLD